MYSRIFWVPRKLGATVGFFTLLLVLGIIWVPRKKSFLFFSFFGCANPHFSIPADGCLLFGDPKEESPKSLIQEIKTEVTRM